MRWQMFKKGLGMGREALWITIIGGTEICLSALRQTRKAIVTVAWWSAPFTSIGKNEKYICEWFISAVSALRWIIACYLPRTFHEIGTFLRPMECKHISGLGYLKIDRKRIESIRMKSSKSFNDMKCDICVIYSTHMFQIYGMSTHTNVEICTDLLRIYFEQFKLWRVFVHEDEDDTYNMRKKCRANIPTNHTIYGQNGGQKMRQLKN